MAHVHRRRRVSRSRRKVSPPSSPSTPPPQQHQITFTPKHHPKLLLNQTEDEDQHSTRRLSLNPVVGEQLSKAEGSNHGGSLDLNVIVNESENESENDDANNENESENDEKTQNFDENESTTDSGRIATTTMTLTIPTTPIKKFNVRDSLTVGNGLFVQESNIPDAGLGLFTSVKLVKNQCVTKYEGTVMTYKQALKLNKFSHTRSLDSQHSVIQGIDDPVLVQGKGGASFANDARNSSEKNNTIFKKHYMSNGQTCIYLRAAREIMPGEEIFVSYGRVYWHRVKDMELSESSSEDDDEDQETTSDKKEESDDGRERIPVWRRRRKRANIEATQSNKRRRRNVIYFSKRGS